MPVSDFRLYKGGKQLMQDHNTTDSIVIKLQPQDMDTLRKTA